LPCLARRDRPLARAADALILARRHLRPLRYRYRLPLVLPPVQPRLCHPAVPRVRALARISTGSVRRPALAVRIAIGGEERIVGVGGDHWGLRVPRSFRMLKYANTAN